jgi:hypothetical protein
VDIFQSFFEQVVDLCQEAGLVWGRELYSDATKVEANAGIPSLIPRFYYEAKTHVADLFTDEFAVEEANPEPTDDLAAGIATDARSHRIVAAGHLIILHEYGDYGDSYWAARYATVFDRAEAMGLRFVGPHAPYGRQVKPRPAELPEGSLNVPTYRTWRQGPMGAARQLDFVFASHALADRLSVRALNTDPGEWGPSDHCRVVIELQS